MAQADEADVAFRVVGDQLDPEHVTEQLKLQPTAQHRKGDPRKTLRGPHKWGSGVWLMNSQLPATAPVEDHLTYLLDQLESQRTEIAAFIAEGFQVDFYVGYFVNKDQGGPVWSPQLLRRLADLGVEVGMDIYFGGEG